MAVICLCNSVQLNGLTREVSKWNGKKWIVIHTEEIKEHSFGWFTSKPNLYTEDFKRDTKNLILNWLSADIGMDIQAKDVFIREEYISVCCRMDNANEIDKNGEYVNTFKYKICINEVPADYETVTDIIRK